MSSSPSPSSLISSSTLRPTMSKGSPPPPPPALTIQEFGILVAHALDADRFSETFLRSDPELFRISSPAADAFQVHDLLFPSPPPILPMLSPTRSNFLQKIKRQATALVHRDRVLPVVPNSVQVPSTVVTPPATFFDDDDEDDLYSNEDDDDFIPYLPLAGQYERAATAISPSPPTPTSPPSPSPRTPPTPTTPSSASSTSTFSTSSSSAASFSTSSSSNRWSLVSDAYSVPDHPFVRASIDDPFAKASVQVVARRAYPASKPPPAGPLPSTPDAEWTLRLGTESPIPAKLRARASAPALAPSPGPPAIPPQAPASPPPPTIHVHPPPPTPHATPKSTPKLKHRPARIHTSLFVPLPTQATKPSKPDEDWTLSLPLQSTCPSSWYSSQAHLPAWEDASLAPPSPPARRRKPTGPTKPPRHAQVQQAQAQALHRASSPSLRGPSPSYGTGTGTGSAVSLALPPPPELSSSAHRMLEQHHQRQRHPQYLPPKQQRVSPSLQRQQSYSSSQQHDRLQEPQQRLHRASSPSLRPSSHSGSHSSLRSGSGYSYVPPGTASSCSSASTVMPSAAQGLRALAAGAMGAGRPVYRGMAVGMRVVEGGGVVRRVDVCGGVDVDVGVAEMGAGPELGAGVEMGAEVGMGRSSFGTEGSTWEVDGRSAWAEGVADGYGSSVGGSAGELDDESMASGTYYSAKSSFTL